MNTEETERFVSIPLDRAIEIARLMESIVISLDRIGSRQAGGEADAHRLDEFITEWLIGPRLSRARFVLWDAIAEEIDEETVAEIAESTPRFPDPVPDEVLTLRAKLEACSREQVDD